MGFWGSRQTAKSGGIAGLGLARARRKEPKKEGELGYVRAMRERTAVEKETLAFKKEQAKRIGGKKIGKYADESKETKVRKVTIKRIRG